MSPSGDLDSLEIEIRSMRSELERLRTEQQELARSVEQLVVTFRSLAMHLGIATEPYGKAKATAATQDVPGFA